jgi:nucleoside-diphosphate-sugar epimerase
MSQRVLVTGANGFTGRHMVHRLQQLGYEVWGLGSQHDTTLAHCKIVLGDLTQPDSLQYAVEACQPHYVIHLAGIAFVGHRSSTEFYQVNLLGTQHLLHALATYAKDLKCVLLASSANVYGNSTEGLISETAVCNPANDYAVSKLSMEFMAKLWLAKLPIVIARPFNYTGVGQTDHFLIPKIVSHFLAKKSSIELGNLDVWREFNDVRDVTNAYAKLIHAAPIGQTINVCSGHLISLREVIALATEITQHAIDIQVNTHFVRANEVISLGGDSTLLKQYLPDWQPRLLRETLDWMLTTGQPHSIDSVQ